jgi:hypothetical protein
MIEKKSEDFRDLLHSTEWDDFEKDVVDNFPAHPTAQIRFANLAKDVCKKRWGRTSKTKMTIKIKRMKKSNINTEFEEFCRKLK